MHLSLLVTDAYYDISKLNVEKRFNNKRSNVKVYLAANHAQDVGVDERTCASTGNIDVACQSRVFNTSVLAARKS